MFLLVIAVRKGVSARSTVTCIHTTGGALCQNIWG